MILQRLGAEIRRRAEDNDLDIETDAVNDLAQRIGRTIKPESIDERVAKRPVGRALGEEYIQIAHRRAEELTGPVGCHDALALATELPLALRESIRPSFVGRAEHRRAGRFVVLPCRSLDRGGRAVRAGRASVRDAVTDREQFARPFETWTPPSSTGAPAMAPGEIERNAEPENLPSTPACADGDGPVGAHGCASRRTPHRS